MRLNRALMVLGARAWWALDLLISMRGIGWNFASADVRHDTSPWQPPSNSQLRRATTRLLPVLFACILTLRAFHPSPSGSEPSITSMAPPARLLFVAATGISLYALFDFGYTLCSAIASPVLHDAARSLRTVRIHRALHGKRSSSDDRVDLRDVDFFPLLNPMSLTDVRSVRGFWSKVRRASLHCIRGDTWQLSGKKGNADNSATLIRRSLSRRHGIGSSTAFSSSMVSCLSNTSQYLSKIRFTCLPGTLLPLHLSTLLLPRRYKDKGVCPPGQPTTRIPVGCCQKAEGIGAKY